MVNGTNTTIPTAAPTLMPTLAPTETDLEVFVEGVWVFAIAFACSSLAIFISGVNIFRHLVYYNVPVLQKNIVRILFMVPFYALFSFLALAFTSGHVLLDSIRDIYEAFVVYCFLNLMLSYCGGENACLSVIMHNPGSISHVFPFNCCFPDMALTSRFLRLCKQGTLQFVIVKPVMAILNLIIIASEKNNSRPWEIFQAVVYNTSYTLALYMLMLFYKATHDHPGLKNQRPILKFLSVKLVVFATYYQGVLVAIVPNIPTETLATLNNFLLCCEMVFFALLQFWAFNWKEFAKPGSKDAHVTSRRDSAFDAFDSIGDIEVGNRGNNNEAALSNAKDVMSMQDVAKDAYYNFNNKYGEHVLLDSRADSIDLGVQTEDEDNEEPSHSKQEEAKPKKMGTLESIGNRLNSLRGIQTRRNSDDSVNPFGAPANFKNSPSGVDTGIHETFDEVQLQNSPDGSHSPISRTSSGSQVGEEVHPTFDPNLPSYDVNSDVMGVAENPFAQESPHGRNRRDSDLSATSFDLNEQHDYRNSSVDFNDSVGWTADFEETPSPEVATASSKKKKKKSKKKKSSADTLSEEAVGPVRSTLSSGAAPGTSPKTKNAPSSTTSIDLI